MLLVPAASVPKHATWDRQVQGEAIQATGVTGLGGLGISSSGLSLWWEDRQRCGPSRDLPGGPQFPHPDSRPLTETLPTTVRDEPGRGPNCGWRYTKWGDRLCQVLGSTHGSEVPADASSDDQR